MKKYLSSSIRFISSIMMWVFIAIDTLAVFISIAILTLFDRNQKITHHIANMWGQRIVRLNPMWKLTIAGRNQIKKNKGYVLIANHNSLADIACLYCLGRHFKWLAKESLFKIPVFGWTMSLLNYIPLRRGEHGSIRDSFQKAQEWLEKNVSVLIFPEGTRSQSGTLGEFKNGAFKLAIRTQKLIIPIVIHGTRQALSKGKATMTAKMNALVKVLPEIPVDGYREDDCDALKSKVWNLMNQELTKA